MSEWTLRPPRVEDAEDVNEVRRCPGVIAGTTALPTERVAGTRTFLESRVGDDRWHALVAVVEERVVAMADLVVQQGKQRHVASVGIMVHDDHQARGIGSALMEALLELADHELGLHRVELEVLAENEHAVRLYERLGFVEEGRKRDAYRREGGFLDLLVMGRVRPGR